MENNSVTGEADLKHKDRPGIVDIEGGQYPGKYIDQNPQTYNQFTLPYPTANFPERKMKYMVERHRWLTDYGNEKKSYFHYFILYFKNYSIMRGLTS